MLATYRTQVPDDPDLRTLVPLLETQSVFVHIPKTAGVAVGEALYGRATGHHWTAREYQLLLTRSEWRSAFKFTFVRDPIERFLSAFDYLRAGGRVEFDERAADATVRRFSDVNDFVEHWLNEGSAAEFIHFRPQCDFVCGRGHRSLIDFVGRFESIDTDYERLRTRLGFGQPMVLANETAQRVSVASALSSDAVDRLVHVYRRDFELFGYKPPAGGMT